ncbi:MAG: DUF4115 domain-containing protein [Dehalococcoidia bacterium]|nr:DUF4115 domain-containing protein [Dehalococcoidia bacterium]
MTRDLVDPAGAPLEDAARYSLSGGVAFDWTAATRHEGRDLQLGRPVRAWMLDAGEGGSHHALLEVARASSRLTSPAFLRVVDALPEAGRLVVILEAPRPASLPPPTAEDDALMRDLAEGLREARGAGLDLQRLPPDLFEQRARLDPIELFLPASAERREQPVGAQLREAVAQALDHGRVPAGSPLHDLERAWPHPESASDATLEEVLDALERATSRRSGGARPEWLPALEEPAHAFVSDEPTLPLAAPRFEAATAPPAPTKDIPTPAPRRVPSSRPGAGRPRLIVLAAVGGLTAAGVLAVSVASLQTRSSAPPPEATTTASEPAAPQAVPGQVLVTLRAQEDTYVRATVDSTVLFDGTMRSGESRSWQGRQRVQVFTNKGRTALLSINGYELGPYSPAMGHPDWNQIDFGFGPDWRP